MDYSLAALKLLCSQLRSARQTTTQNAYTIGGILFQRAWLQGIIISTPTSNNENGGGRYVVDDGTGVFELLLSPDSRTRYRWETGMYIMVVGGYFIRAGDIPMIKVHKIVDLSAFPDRESMWYLEVMEAFRLFYKPLFEER